MHAKITYNSRRRRRNMTQSQLESIHILNQITRTHNKSKLKNHEEKLTKTLLGVLVKMEVSIIAHEVQVLEAQGISKRLN